MREKRQHLTDSRRPNLDVATITGFGDEWSRFTQEDLDPHTREKIYKDYFAIFPWQSLPSDAVGADIGCGSGRWAKVVAPKVGTLHLVDASGEALEVARCNLRHESNVHFHHASIDDLPFDDASLDFAYSLGVLHHVPDTAGAIRIIAGKLKPGAPLLLYLYYAFDNRSIFYRTLWRLADGVRKVVSRMPLGLRYYTSQVLAAVIYWPFARSARLLEWINMLPSGWLLSYYRDKPFYVMRTDSLDRFGTRLEQRFTRDEIRHMLEQAGLKDVRFSDNPPYWCVVSIKE